MKDIYGTSIKIGDIIGNTVNGFDFELLAIEQEFYKVKNILTGKIMRIYSTNMYKSNY